ncbi:MAG: hypothetical protein NZ899_04215 [Thermoguttaceae bacterium]|nr:hypothetical protein [Thermoguttaceae bacterium]MDW8077660.1 hypothetical protein [Thermoguttaceae bacterium]
MRQGVNGPMAWTPPHAQPRHQLFLFICSVVCCLGFNSQFGIGQQVAIQTPLRGVNESFFEAIGTSWALRGRHWFAQFGPPVGAPFGMAGSGTAGAHLGVAFRKGDCSGYLWMHASQGCRRSLVGVSPVVVLTPGWPAWVADISVTPFVMGFIPVVGWAPIIYTPGPVYLPSWWYSPYWWGRGWPYFPHLPPQGPSSPPPWARRPPREADPPPRPDDRRKAFPQHRREAFPKNAAIDAREGANLLAELHQHPDVETPQLGDVLQVGNSRQHFAEAENAAAQQVDDPDLTAGSGGSLALTLRMGQQGSSLPESSAERPALSVAELAALRAAELARQEEEARAYLQRGQNAERQGKPGVAKVYYQMALRKSSGEVRQLASERLTALQQLGAPIQTAASRASQASVDSLR